LLAKLEAGDGSLTLRDPSPEIRRSYRRAVGKVIAAGLVPDGTVLSQSGRSSSDFRIWLHADSDRPVQTADPPIPLPEVLDESNVAVALLSERPALLDVSEDARPRALLIVQAIAEECARRGFRFELRPRDQPSFQITISDDRFPFTLSEEYERRTVPVPEKAAAVKYEWQRVPVEERKVRSGRLVLQLGLGYRPLWWADRKRWTLQQKLPDVFQEIARRAAAQAEDRRREEEERRRRREDWEAAIERARTAYVQRLNSDRLRKQCERFTQAEAIRAYCAQLDDLVTLIAVNSAFPLRSGVGGAGVGKKPGDR
jgi:hypothetical protein